MAVRDVFKVSRKTFFDPRGWLSFDTIKDQNKTLWSLLKPLFTTQKAARKETFEEAIKRLHLTEKDIQDRISSYQYAVMIFSILGLIAVLFGFYLVIAYHTWHGLFLSFAVAAVFFVQVFRYHFWLFQVKNRKLGCTLAEWRQGKIHEGKD